jgi:hypothetical protein
LGTFTVSASTKTVNVPIIGLAQARGIKRTEKVLFRLACLLREPEQDFSVRQSSLRLQPSLAAISRN